MKLNELKSKALALLEDVSREGGSGSWSYDVGEIEELVETAFRSGIESVKTIFPPASFTGDEYEKGWNGALSLMEENITKSLAN